MKHKDAHQYNYHYRKSLLAVDIIIYDVRNYDSGKIAESKKDIPGEMMLPYMTGQLFLSPHGINHTG